MIILFIYAVSLFLFALGVFWVIVPALYSLPSKPTHPERIRHALNLVHLQPNEVLYDLGAGDGRVLLIAAREFGAKAVGIEIGPVQCALIWMRATASGMGSRIGIRWGSYYKSDLSDADVVYVYATLREVMRLAKHLENTMKPGARVVSISADFPEWEPLIFNEEDLIFVYSMPPKYGSLTTYLLEKTK